jgi:vitamin B12/bleomycin/antimicrobial peptide transport system ATP-binding/permease protein
MKGMQQFGYDVWALVKGYWGSEERWSAWAFLAAIISLDLGYVYVNVLLNKANGSVFNALQQYDTASFYRAFVAILVLVLILLAATLLRVFLLQTLQLRWRRWLTDHYLTHWLADRIFYRLRFSGRVDNPDQRIAEDIRLFIEYTLSLGLGLLATLEMLASFSVLLWHLAGSITLPIGGIELTIPGYMFWVAVLYSGVGSWLAHLVGHPLIRLNNLQRSVEADFRFSLVRLREEAEGIALYGGEAQERGIALGRFQALYDNVKRLILRNCQYLMFQTFVGQFANFFPLLVAAPRYFSGAVALGTLTQLTHAFWQVNASLSWFITNYPTFAEWRATVDRLTEFDREMVREAQGEGDGAHLETTAQDTIDFEEVGIALPDGTPLLTPVTLRLRPHETVLLKGPSGCGKSTVFRVLAGLWPFATGRIRLPAGVQTLFLPQRPYMPIGTLRQALWFPAPPALDGDAKARAALGTVGLAALGQRLDETAHWTHVLSPGEQQRLAIARALLLKPDWLFLDEATSALDEDHEATLYRRLAEALGHTTLISIGHRRSLEAYHTRVIAVDREAGHPGVLRAELSISER